MKYEDTTAYRCRYGSTIGVVFTGADIIWEDSTADWQGGANVVGVFDDGTVLHYEWSYGSCSGCDTWEANGSSEQDIIEEVERTMAKMDLETAINYFHHTPDVQKILKEKLALRREAPTGYGRFGEL